MALSKTTLAGGVAVTDIEVTLTAITGLSVGDRILVDGEVMRALTVGSAAATPVGVLRGQRGTQALAHVSGANAVYGPPADFSGVNQAKSKARQRDVVSYSQAGAITLPTPGRDMVAIINGTTARAMTLAVPTKENDGDILVVVSNGKAIHTVTPAGGVAGGALVAGTFDVLGQCAMQFIAANECWVPLASPMSGTLTSIDVAIA